MKWLFAAIGAIAVLLGGLWLVQGLGLVTIPPILCVADCETLEGPAPEWAVAGAALLLAGLGVIWWALRRAR
jgi:hypothetical protein